MQSGSGYPRSFSTLLTGCGNPIRQTLCWGQNQLNTFIHSSLDPSLSCCSKRDVLWPIWRSHGRLQFAVRAASKRMTADQESRSVKYLVAGKIRICALRTSVCVALSRQIMLPHLLPSWHQESGRLSSGDEQITKEGVAESWTDPIQTRIMMDHDMAKLDRTVDSPPTPSQHERVS